MMLPLQWRHNERDGVSNHRGLDCLSNRLFRCRSTIGVTSLFEGNPLVAGEFPSQRFINAENVFIWLSHHAHMHQRLQTSVASLVSINRLKYDPFATFTFRAQRGSDPIMFEIFFIQLYDYINENELLYKSQYGFRALHSTETASLEITDIITKALDRANFSRLIKSVWYLGSQYLT